MCQSGIAGRCIVTQRRRIVVEDNSSEGAGPLFGPPPFAVASRTRGGVVQLRDRQVALWLIS